MGPLTRLLCAVVLVLSNCAGQDCVYTVVGHPTVDRDHLYYASAGHASQQKASLGSGHSNELSEGHARIRFGTENEKLGYNVATTQRVTYEEVAQLLNGLVRRFGWAPMMEAGRIIGAELDGQSVTLEPGGQFELSGAPVDTLHKTCAEVNQHLYQAWPCQAAVLAGTGGQSMGIMGVAPHSIIRRTCLPQSCFL